MSRSITWLSLSLAAVVLFGCGTASAPDPGAAADDAGADQPVTSDPDGGAAGGTCLEGTPDCVDADLDGDDPGEPTLDGVVDDDTALRDARSLLGEPEEQALARFDDVRLGRHGDETYALTEDYVIGRKTISTDDDGSGTYRVVEVVVETNDGPQTVIE